MKKQRHRAVAQADSFMAARKRDKREREASAEPMESEQASIQQTPAEMARARVWRLHMRGYPKVRIAAEVNLDRGTVSKIITAYYADIRDEGKSLRRDARRELDEAIQRMRMVQQQAWDDHDADDEREQRVLALSIAQANQVSDDDEPRKGRESAVSIRYQSQRSQYLRIILDAEKEIARLEGLYEGLLDVEGAAVFRITKLSPEAASALSAANRRSLPAPAESSDGESAAS